MLDVVTTSFFIKSPTFDKAAFEYHSSELFDQWDAQVEAHLQLPDYALTLVLEEGSIKGKGRVAAAAAAFYFGIGAYGDFMSGLGTVRDQAAYISNVLFEQAKGEFACSSERGNTKRTGGEIIYLQRLFERVQHGALTPEQAIREVKSRWGEEAASSPGFMRELAANLEEAPRFPEQLSLMDESWPDCLDLEPLDKEPGPRTPRSPDFPIPQHYRIEISRPSKGDKRKVKLTKVR
ncbi:hypothetical protein [Halomonas heilongjiangensis]|uniref:Uncharacterized protein n=1 Tax=Halomonas heilongjiangensis TaxID=1387883 RepID=A0A2N7TFZ1_9GAMM|nr:hypothetical protein [Halomonas heilongjiangensis]PMR67101.1 hypothetical protein C1H66_20695 [Halomonas heilongjiangensis]PXX87838.1 hypothetical protein CR158_15955 [Halomonas heilongjiangensis]